jgi:protocatechuate 3,4-dioxygenase beta subunit
VSRRKRLARRVPPLASLKDFSRREALGVLGAAGAVLVLACGADAVSAGSDGGTENLGGDGGTSTTADGGTAATDGGGVSCVLDPNVTKGPYWIDERLNRSDIRSDSNGLANPNPRPGLPLTLRFAVMAYSSGSCSPLSGAQVDIWHCDGSGLYSDVSNIGGSSTAGQNFLRGYQVTDSDGLVTFTTIYPGWYSGRAVHIHVKVRLFDSSSNTTTEATTQVFFDDSTTDAVYSANAPYNTRSARDTRNSADNIYNQHTELLLSLSGSASSGYTGTITLGVQVGTISAG